MFDQLHRTRIAVAYRNVVFALVMLASLIIRRIDEDIMRIPTHLD